MRFIITGGAGFIGSAVCRFIIENTTHDLLIVDSLTYAGNLDNIKSVLDDPRARFVHGDIADGEHMRDVIAGFRPDVVMNLAAESHVDRSIDGPSVFVRTNVNGTVALLEAATAYWRTLAGEARDRFRFHQVSTDEVFGSLGAEGYFDERTAYDPKSPYSASKVAADHFVRAWENTYGLPTLVTNCSNNYGSYHFPEKLVPLTILNALEGKTLPVYGRGENVRDWLYVADHAAALVLVAERATAGTTYMVGGSSERRNVDVVRTICAVLDELSPDPCGEPRERLIRFVPDRPGHDHRYAVDAGLVRQELGWEPRETFESGIRKTVRWYLDNRAWWEPLRAGRYGGERLGLTAG